MPLAAGDGSQACQASQAARRGPPRRQTGGSATDPPGRPDYARHGQPLFRIHGRPSIASAVSRVSRTARCLRASQDAAALRPASAASTLSIAVSTTQRPSDARSLSLTNSAAQRRARLLSAAASDSNDWTPAGMLRVASPLPILGPGQSAPPLVISARLPLNERPSVSRRRITGLTSLKRVLSTRPSKHLH